MRTNDARIHDLLREAVLLVGGKLAFADHVIDSLAAHGEPAEQAAAEAVGHARNRALAGGWSERDLEALTRQRLRVRRDAPTITRLVHVLALLQGLRPIPSFAEPSATATDDPMLAKIRALLAKAESTTFDAEAEALSAKAQELMARHRIDRVAVTGEGAEGGPTARRVWLDDPYAKAKGELLVAVASANRCRVISLGGLDCMQVIGFPRDVEVTELLYTSLLVQSTAAMTAAGPQTDGTGQSTTRSFRQAFLVAYARRIGQRLHEVARNTEEHADREQGGALLPVLAGRTDAIDRAVDDAFGKLRTARGTTSSNPAGWAAGRQAADRADLDTGRRVRGSKGALGS